MVRALLLILSCLLFGCEPKLVVGERPVSAAGAGGAGGDGGSAGSAGSSGTDSIAGSGGDGGDGGEAGAQCPDTGMPIPGKTDPIAVPWATGFENGFCDYTQAGGVCVGEGIRKIVTSPSPHAGNFAAEFSVTSAVASGVQARCVREGALPNEATYGAWYYVSNFATLPKSSSLWNLFHFQGVDASTKGLWDVSLIDGTDGNLHLVVFDFLDGQVKDPLVSPAPIVPIGSWFHLRFYLKRRSDATGEVRVYQDETLVVQVKNLVTDNSTLGQWYVGNIATDLTPPDSTVYVDDVTIDSP